MNPEAGTLKFCQQGSFLLFADSANGVGMLSIHMFDDPHGDQKDHNDDFHDGSGGLDV